MSYTLKDIFEYSNDQLNDFLKKIGIPIPLTVNEKRYEIVKYLLDNNQHVEYSYKIPQNLASESMPTNVDTSSENFDIALLVADTIDELNYFLTDFNFRFISSMRQNTIQILDLNYHDLNSKDIKYISEVLKTNTSVTDLRFIASNIDSKGAKYLSEALKINTSLKNLNLYSNKIGDEGAKYIAEALKVNTTLTILHLEYNSIDWKGTKYIAEALKVNTTLTNLDLEDNKIGAEGAKYLAGALKINNSLKILPINPNDIGIDGVLYLLDVLVTNASLIYLGYTIDRGEPALKDLLERNKSYNNFMIPQLNFERDTLQIGLKNSPIRISNDIINHFISFHKQISYIKDMI